MSNEWLPIDLMPSINDNTWWEAKSDTYGICRVRWMLGEVGILEIHPPNGGPVFYRHLPGNRAGYPSVQETLTHWRYTK
jgi:hypothetical protein